MEIWKASFKHVSSHPFPSRITSPSSCLTHAAPFIKALVQLFCATICSVAQTHALRHLSSHSCHARHPHVSSSPTSAPTRLLQMFGFATSPNRELVVLMEYAEQISVEHFIRRNGPRVPFRERQRLCDEMAQAVTYLHNHRYLTTLPCTSVLLQNT